MNIQITTNVIKTVKVVHINTNAGLLQPKQKKNKKYYYKRKQEAKLSLG